MGLAAFAARAVERTSIPDPLTRLGVRMAVARARRRLRDEPRSDARAFAREMETRPVAEATAEANRQHYEVPAAFFRQVLGPNLKYSCCLYGEGAESLAAAEARALAETCAHADLSDGQRVLELGCGWGSLSLWMAERYPRSTITSVSNSHSQRQAIQAQARARGLTNLEVITCDMNDFMPSGVFDRIVSVEMFEHMSNWRALLARLAPALRPEGRLFLHVFTHKNRAYRFRSDDPDDFIAQHFFTGGVMPSHDLIAGFSDLFTIEEEWRWSGRHYERTALDWLANFDRDIEAISPILVEVYGRDAGLWKRRWRLFFLAVAGLFGDSGGEVWGVSHYRLAPAQ
jgi:cyclopropane-fatty-acyl-phospholipid synthase